MKAATSFRHLSACYSAAVASFQLAAPGTAQRQIALDSANRLWNLVAEAVALRNIRAARAAK